MVLVISTAFLTLRKKIKSIHDDETIRLEVEGKKNNGQNYGPNSTEIYP